MNINTFGTGCWGRGKAALLAGVSAICVGVAPALAAPWIIDTAGTYTIPDAQTYSDDVWVGLDTPGVELDITGTSAPASLTIDSGKSFHLGINSGAAGSVLVLTGASAINGATLASGDQILVGQDSDNNRVTLNGYATITGTSVVLGINDGADGNKLELKSGTSLVEISNNLIIGNKGDNNSATLENGATLTASGPSSGQVILGYEAGSDGNSLTLSTGAQVSATLGTAVGYRGSNNSVVIQSGADYSTFTSSLGNEVGADGNSLTVTGAGSTFTGVDQLPNKASFNVGGHGDDNSLTVADGAVFQIGDRLAIGQKTDSGDNTATVTGVGSALYAGNIRIGASSGVGGNSLVVADGGYVDVTTDIKVRAGNAISLASGATLDMVGFTAEAGSTFIVDVDADNAIDMDVTGTANLSGTLEVNWTGGAISNRYNLLTAGTRSGTFTTVDDSGFAPAFSVSVDYYGTGADLLLVADLAGTSDLADNEANAADAVSAAFNNGETLGAAFAPIFAVDPALLNETLASLTGEINAYAQTELGWKATERVLAGLTGPEACTPETTATYCTTAFARGVVGSVGGDEATGSHDTSEAGAAFGVAATARIDEGMLLGGVVSIDQSHAEIDGLGTADLTSIRLGASLKQYMQQVYVAVGGLGGIGVGETNRALASVTPGSASGTLDQTYLGFRAELGADLALGGDTTLTPYAALGWANTDTTGYTEDVSGDFADLALDYAGGGRARSSVDIGLRLKSGDAATGLALGGSLAYRHVLAADSAVATEFAGLEGYAFDVTPATAPADQLLLSADASAAISEATQLGFSLDAGLAAGYATVAGKVSLTGQW
jgi:hypothetical protein